MRARATRPRRRSGKSCKAWERHASSAGGSASAANDRLLWERVLPQPKSRLSGKSDLNPFDDLVVRDLPALSLVVDSPETALYRSTTVARLRGLHPRGCSGVRVVYVAF